MRPASDAATDVVVPYVVVQIGAVVSTVSLWPFTQPAYVGVTVGAASP